MSTPSKPRDSAEWRDEFSSGPLTRSSSSLNKNKQQPINATTAGKSRKRLHLSTGNNTAKKHIFIIQHSLLPLYQSLSLDTIQLLTYKHTGTQQLCRYCIVNNVLLCQVQQITNNMKPSHPNTTYQYNTIDYSPLSYFIHNTIITDESLYLCTAFDPLYMILEICSDQRIVHDKYIALDTILNQYNFPIQLLVDGSVLQSQLQHIFEIRDGWNSSVYKINKDKCMIWLDHKYQQIKQHITDNHQLLNELRFEYSMNQPYDTIIEHSAYKLLFDYLCDYWITEYCTYRSFDITLLCNKPMLHHTSKHVNTQGKSSDSAWLGTSNNVSADIDFNSTENLVLKSLNKQSQSGEVKKIAAANKKLATINTTGMKSMNSFFTKK